MAYFVCFSSSFLIQRFDISENNCKTFTHQYMHTSPLLDHNKPILPMGRLAFSVKRLRMSELFNHHNNMILFELPMIPEFVIPLLSPFSSPIPASDSLAFKNLPLHPGCWFHPVSIQAGLPLEQPTHRVLLLLSTLLAGSLSWPLKISSGLKCQLDNVDIWQTELSASLQAVWAVSQ